MNFDEQLDHLIDAALKEDIGEGDHSTLSCIPAGAKGKALLKIKEDGVLAGMNVAERSSAINNLQLFSLHLKKTGRKWWPEKRLLK